MCSSRIKVSITGESLSSGHAFIIVTAISISITPLDNERGRQYELSFLLICLFIFSQECYVCLYVSLF